MGCGVSKTSVESPVSADGDALSEPCQSPVPIEQPLLDEVKQDPISLKSFSPKSMLDSDAKSTTSTTGEDESAPASPTPPGQGEQGKVERSPIQPSPTVEMKKGFVAFDVPLDDSQPATLDSVLRKPLPRRLRHLEPLGNAPQITQEKLMEKLEKAEEKRQKALAKYKAQSSRRKELAMRRNEQMGDVVSSSHADDMLDSDQSVTEKCDAGKPSDSNEMPTNTCDQNVNWNEAAPSRSPADPNNPSSPSNLDSVNQNNNNVEPRIHLQPEDPTLQDFPVKATRFGCYLQAVQEEEETGGSSSDPDSFSIASYDNIVQRNNNCRRTHRLRRATKPLAMGQ